MKRVVPLLVAIALLWIIPAQSQAYSICACFFGEKNDCAYETSSAITTENLCDIACETKYKELLNTSRFHATITYGAYEINQQCNDAHRFANSLEAPKEAVIPELAFPIPGFTFSNIIDVDGELYINFLGEYVNAMYQYLLGIGVMIAIVLILVGGFQWSVGAASSDQQSKGKTRIKNAVIGLVLLICVSVILEIVNPRLTTFVPLQLKYIPEIPPEQHDDPGDVVNENAIADIPNEARGGNFFDGGALCSSPSACIAWCASNPNKKEWPSANRKTIDPTYTRLIPNLPGITNPKKMYATEHMISLLEKAGQVALSKNPNYILEIRSAFRPMRTQIQIVCDKVKLASSQVEPSKSKTLNKIGKIVAYPGASNHGSGNAVDLLLKESGKSLTTTSSDDQDAKRYQEPAKILADIMDEAGFVRYAKEIWHFEPAGKTTSDCRCKGSAQCPFPASCKF